MEFADDEKRKKVEVIHEALNQFIEQRRNGIDEMKQEQVDEETQLLSRLLSKLDSVESDSGRDAHLPPEPSRNEERECEKREVEVDKIAKELRVLRWQNTITHCLLLATIGITTFWQLSEVSLLIKVRETFSHPLKAVGNMIQGTLKGQDKKHLDEVPLLPHIDVPKFPHLEVPSLNLNSLED